MAKRWRRRARNVRNDFKRFAKTIKSHKKAAEAGAAAVALLAAGVTAPAAAIEAASALGLSEAQVMAGLEWLETQLGTVAAVSPAEAELQLAVARGALNASYAL